jgi:chaperonin GroES
VRTEIQTAPGAQATLRPVHDYVVVLPIKSPDKIGKIIVPDEVKDKPKRQGIVVSVGPGTWNQHKFAYDPVSVKPKDRILFGSWAGTDITLAGKELLLVRDSDILGIIDEVVER